MRRMSSRSSTRSPRRRAGQARWRCVRRSIRRRRWSGPSESRPVKSFRAPGRVNLIGDHTDYNEGFVLPIASASTASCGDPAHRRGRARDLARPRRGRQRRGRRQHVPDAVEPAWGRYAAEVVRPLAERGREPAGIDAVVSSTVPLAPGSRPAPPSRSRSRSRSVTPPTSSSTPVELALACQEAERIATGVPVGIMDQLASIAGRRGHALLIDCRSLEIEPIPLPPRLTVLIVHSGVSRTLVDSAYAERRRTCEMPRPRLGVRALRDATPEQVAASPAPGHVVSENARLEAARALSAGDDRRARPAAGREPREPARRLRGLDPGARRARRGARCRGSLGARLTGAGSAAASSVWRAVTRPTRSSRRPPGATTRTGRQPRAFVTGRWTVPAWSASGRRRVITQVEQQEARRTPPGAGGGRDRARGGTRPDRGGRFRAPRLRGRAPATRVREHRPVLREGARPLSGSDLSRAPAPAR